MTLGKDFIQPLSENKLKNGLRDLPEEKGKELFLSMNLQICFRNQNMIDNYLKFKGSEDNL